MAKYKLDRTVNSFSFSSRARLQQANGIVARVGNIYTAIEIDREPRDKHELRLCCGSAIAAFSCYSCSRSSWESEPSVNAVPRLLFSTKFFVGRTE